MTTNCFPGSAVSSWSGFVYQGKVAVYHCLKLLSEDPATEDFELQLDSTDDFAIYDGISVVSAHQVKAKTSPYRSSYLDALEKSAIIEHDRTISTKRWFHVSVEIDNQSEYIHGNGVKVEFYTYGTNNFCLLSEIESKVKTLCEAILDKALLTYSSKTLDLAYCQLSELVTRRIIAIHAENQVNGTPLNEVAYNSRIKFSELKAIILSQYYANDFEFHTITFRKNIGETFEEHILNNLDGYSDKQFVRLKNTFDYLFSIDNDELEKLCHIIQPTQGIFRSQTTDIQAYSDLVCGIDINPRLIGLPHYLDGEGDFYLPTGIELPTPMRVATFRSTFDKVIRDNQKLSTLLFEYKNLIAEINGNGCVVTSITSHDPNDHLSTMDPRFEKRITKELSVNILSRSDAEKKLNA